MEEKIVDCLLGTAKREFPTDKENLLDSTQKTVQAGEVKTLYQEGRLGRR